MKQSTKKGATKRAKLQLPKLSTAANVRRVLEILSNPADTRFSDYRDTVSEVIADAGEGFDIVETARTFLAKSARRLERDGVSHAYESLQKMLATGKTWYELDHENTAALRAATRRVNYSKTNIVARVQNILDNPKVYDAGTRDAIKSKYEACGDADELVELINRAEQGGRLIADDMPAPELIRRAREIVADAETYDANDRRYIRNSLATSDPDDLARDIALVEGGDFSSDLDADPRALPTLPEMLADVMTHPDLPAEILGGIGDALNTLFTQLTVEAQRYVEHNETYIGRLLARHKTDRRDDEQKGGK